MDKMRRSVLRSAGSAGTLAAAMALGILRPSQVRAAEWNKAAFESKDMASATKSVGVTSIMESKDLRLKAPEIAENGAVVPVDAISNIPNTTAISIFVEKNPSPLSAHFDFRGALPEASVRLKMGQTSKVTAIALADGKFYSTSQEVKVTAGGCGG